MNKSIEIHEIVEKDLKDSVLIVGFPSVGLIGTIVSNFLINTLKLEDKISCLHFKGLFH